MFEKKLYYKDVYIFLFLGIATSYFDLLSYPLVTFGVPAVFYFCFGENVSIKKNILSLTKIGFAWCIGYGGMWVSKWMVGSAITGKDLLSDGINQAIYRAGDGAGMNSSENFSAIETIVRNIKAFIFTPVSLVFGAFTIMIILIFRLLFKTNISFVSVLKLSFPFIIIMAAPFVWYVLIRNHSAIHFFPLANKELVIAAMAFLCLCTKLYLWLKAMLNMRNKENRT